MTALLDTAGDALAKATGLTPTQARGTLRLLLKERGLEAAIARKADYLALLGEPLADALTKRRVTVPGSIEGTMRRAIEAAAELEDAYDLFKDID